MRDDVTLRFAAADVGGKLDEFNSVRNIDWLSEVREVKSPYKDFQGNDIYEGDQIAHPSGQKGKVVFHSDRQDDSDRWCIAYENCAFESRLCLQIGERGRAVVST